MELAPGVVIGVAESPSQLSAMANALDEVAFTLVTFASVDRRTVQVDDLADAVTSIEKVAGGSPIAAATAVGVLRVNERLPVADGLIVESLAYSTLQGGPEFAAWLAGRRRKAATAEGEAVLLSRAGDGLTITLNRPERHNALNTAMRDGLLDALAVAASAPELSVSLGGSGPSFCSGGDLDEFGTFTDPATAHTIRTSLSIGARLEPLADRATAHIHGFTGGSGLELAAFCGQVRAAPDTQLFLPEIGLGLIPGAGGTVSIPRRIGRWRTAWLLLSGTQIGATTAREWGLVDAVV